MVSHEPVRHIDVPLGLQSLRDGHSLDGTTATPSGCRVACGVIAIREDDGHDWLDFSIPLGALAIRG